MRASLLTRVCLTAGVIAVIALSLSLFSLAGIATLAPDSDQFLKPSRFLERMPTPEEITLPENIRLHGRVAENLESDGKTWHRFGGEILSSPFRAPEFMVVPIYGYFYEPVPEYLNNGNQFRRADASIALVCEDDGRRIELLTAPTPSWILKPVHVPSDWCLGLSWLMARANTGSVAIGLGSAYEITWVSWLSSGVLGQVAAMILSILFVALVTLPFIVDGRYSPLQRVVIAFLYITFCGYFTYQLGYRGLPKSYLTLLAFIQVSAPSIILLYKNWRKHIRMDIELAKFWIFGYALCAGLVIIGLLIQVGNGRYAPGYTFSPVAWALDNQLPFIMARFITEIGGGHPPLGIWSVSDRGITPAGFLTSFLLFTGQFGDVGNSPFLYILANAFQAVVQASVIPTMLILTWRNGWSRGQIISFAICLLVTPFVFFNIYYVWAKLFGGLMGVLAALLASNSFREKNAYWLALSIVCFAAAGLHHSSNLISAPAFALFILLVFFQFHQDVKSYQMALLKQTFGVIFVACVFSAALFIGQSSLEKSSGLGLSLLLTGEFSWKFDDGNFISQIMAFYDSISFQHWLDIKFNQVAIMIWPNWVLKQYCLGENAIDCLRWGQFMGLSLAISPGLLALALRFLPSPSRSRKSAGSGLVRDLQTLGLASLVTLPIMILIFNTHMLVHHIPYNSVLALLLGALSCLASMSSIRRNICVVISVLNLFIVWFVGAWLHWMPLG
jgi:hypothetical protein